MEIAEIICFENLLKAWEKICSKNSASGADEISVADFSKNIEYNLRNLSFDIINGIYRPVPVKIFGEDRKIAIVSVRDKIVLYALNGYMSPEVEKLTIRSNFGYLQGRSVYGAADYINFMIRSRKLKVFYRCDIKAFFGSIDHAILQDKIGKVFGNVDIVRLIELFVKCEQLIDDRIVKPEKGIILGSPISPVLSNLYMLEADRIFKSKFDLYVRYSDDILIGSEAGFSSNDAVFLRDELSNIKLLLNEEKSGIVDLATGFTYLGGEFRETAIDMPNSGTTGILSDDIINDRYTEILKYLDKADDTASIDIGKLILAVKNSGKRKYAVIALIFLSRNDMTLSEEDENIFKEIIGIQDLTDLKNIISCSADMEAIIIDIVKYFIALGIYGLAEELNTGITSEEETADDSKDISVENKNRYIELFCTGKNAYARGYADIYGKRCYYKVNMSFTIVELDKMLEDMHSVGIYPLNEDETCSYIVIDLDIDKRILLECDDGGSVFEDMLRRTKEFALHIKRLLMDEGVFSYVEFSGYKGYHVWVFLNENMHITEIHSIITKITACADKPRGINLEMIPSPGHDDREIIKLPLSYHELSNKQAVFIDDEGLAAGNQFEFISKIVRNDAAAFKTAASGNCCINEGEKTVETPTNAEIGDFPEYITAIYHKCSLVRSIVERSLRDNYLTHYERNAILYVFGHAGEKGRQFMHFVMSKCLNYSFEVTEGFIARIMEKPVSCQKLCLRFPNMCINEQCDSAFADYPFFYPSPVIHGYMISAENVTKPDYLDKGSRIAEICRINEQLKMNNLVARLIEITRKKKEIEKEMKMCCDELETVFETRGISECEVDSGMLIKKGDEWYLKVL